MSILSLSAVGKVQAQDISFPPLLTEEMPVSPPAFGPAPRLQHTPLIASNGEISLVAWSDGRMGGGIEQIYVARLDRDGNLLDPLGIPLDESAYPNALIWNGQHFVLISSRDLGVFGITRLDPDGRVVRRERLEMGWEWRVSSSRSGNNARVMFVKRYPAIKQVRVFDGNLNPITPEITLPELPGGQTERFLLTGMLRDDDDFLVVRGIAESADCARFNTCSRMVSTRFDSSGRILSSEESDTPINGNQSTLVLTGGKERYLFLYQDSTTAAVRSFPLDRSGAWIRGVAVLYPGDGHGPIERPRPSLIFDGQRFIAAWIVSYTGSRSQIHSAEVDEKGVLVRSSPVTPPIPFTNHLILGHNAGRRTVVAGSWPDAGSSLDLFAHSFSSGEESAVHSVLLSVSAHAQIEPVTASSDRGYAVVWREVDPGPAQNLLIRRFGPSGQPVGEPVVVASFPCCTSRNFLQTFGLVSSGEVFLVVWQDDKNLNGRRMAASGHWLDAEGFVIDPSAYFDRQGLGSNGTDFLVAWTARGGDYKAFVRSIQASGPLLHERVALASGADQHTPALASNGSDYFVVWSDGFRHCQILCPGYPFFELRGIRLRSDGQSIGAPPVVLDRDHGYPIEPSIIWDGTRYLGTYRLLSITSSLSEIRAIRLAVDGTIVETGGDGGGVIIRSPERKIAGHLIANLDGGILLTERASGGPDPRDTMTLVEGTAIRNDRSLAEAAALPAFPIVTNGLPGYPGEGFSVSGASRGDQLLVAYSRIRDPQIFGGVRRVWVRMFGKPGPPRRRAVRR